MDSVSDRSEPSREQLLSYHSMCSTEVPFAIKLVFSHAD